MRNIAPKNTLKGAWTICTVSASLYATACWGFVLDLGSQGGGGGLKGDCLNIRRTD